MPTSFEDASDALFPAVSGILGDTIIITPQGGQPVSVTAFVDFGDAVPGTGSGAAIAQAMTVELDIALYPTKPSDTTRISAIASRPGKIFKPTGVRLSESGRSWLFDLATVAA